MSKLFDKIYNYYRNSDYVVILTALNPMLGFKGSIFKGSSYFQFARSPMKYSYDKYGIYLNRRNEIDQEVFKQMFNTPSIIWLARGTNKNYQERIEKNKLIYNISVTEYNKG